jgi:hypothetical protein
MHLWVTYSLVQFSSYGLFKSIHLTSSSNLTNGFFNFGSGAVASLLATAITYPLDIMRTQFAIQVPSQFHDDQ